MTAETPIPAREYFRAHSLLRTDDLDEARHSVSKRFCDHRLDLCGRSAKLSVRHNAVAGRHLSVNYLSYGSEVTVDPGELGSFYLLHLPLSGKALVQHRGDEVVAGLGKATILNPDRPARLRWGADCRQLLFQIDKAYLEAVAQVLTGAPLPGPVRFDTELDLSTPRGNRLHKMMRACAGAIEGGLLFRGPLGSSDLRAEDDLVHALLTCQRSNIYHVIERADTRARPREIRLALEFIHARLDEQITLQDIAKAAGVNIRTLQKGFRRHLGLTPTQVLRDARLDAAHYLLLSRKDPPTVTAAAYSCGFSHLGRFSRDYRDRFGHPPSETRRIREA